MVDAGVVALGGRRCVFGYVRNFNVPYRREDRNQVSLCLWRLLHYAVMRDLSSSLHLVPFGGEIEHAQLLQCSVGTSRSAIEEQGPPCDPFERSIDQIHVPHT